MPRDLVIFDCDGVLIDSEPLALRAMLEMLASAGCDMSAAQAAELFLGLSWPSTRALLEQDHGVKLSEQAIEQNRLRLLELFSAELSPIAGVEAALDALEALGVARCVASSSDPARLDFSLKAAGLLDRLAPDIFSSTMVARGKPHPDLFLYAADRMGVDPARCLVVEDSPAGVCAAKSAGMRVCAFVGGGHAKLFDLRSRVSALEPDGVLENLAQLPAFVR